MTDEVDKNIMCKFVNDFLSLLKNSTILYSSSRTIIFSNKSMADWHVPEGHIIVLTPILLFQSLSKIFQPVSSGTILISFLSYL